MIVYMLSGFYSRASALTLSVYIEKVMPVTGVLFLSIFNSPYGFPGEYKKAFRTGNHEVSASTEVFHFEDMSVGEYAVSVLHDENNNGKMDFSWIGAPSEGYGASNDAHAWFGPPRWSDAKFVLSDDLTVTIELR